MLNVTSVIACLTSPAKEPSGLDASLRSVAVDVLSLRRLVDAPKMSGAVAH